MATNLIRGVASGALGTAALNMTTYLDVAFRGRPMTSVPQKEVQELADKTGIDLSAG